MTEIKKEILSNVLSYKDVFLENGIILEDFDFGIENYEQLLREPFLAPEMSIFYLRIPFKYISKGVFEFSIFLNLGFEPEVEKFFVNLCRNIA